MAYLKEGDNAVGCLTVGHTAESVSLTNSPVINNENMETAPTVSLS